jgi:hypothetical protein
MKVDRKKPFLPWLDSFDPHEPWNPPSIWDPSLKCPYDPDYGGIETVNPVPTFADWYLSGPEAHHIHLDRLYLRSRPGAWQWRSRARDYENMPAPAL